MGDKYQAIQPMQSFEQAVKATPDIEGHYQPGLQALGNNAEKVQPVDPRQLTGSVDIDEATKHLYPEESRWDYAVGYGEYAYFVEVHPASTSEVECVLKKKDWLMNWLGHKAPCIRMLASPHPRILYWVFTKGCGIRPGSPQWKRLAEKGIKVVKRLKLGEESRRR